MDGAVRQVSPSMAVAWTASDTPGTVQPGTP
jgi:hypothetical protein